MFVDDVVIARGGSREEWIYLHNILKILCEALGLEVNEKKYSLIYFCKDQALKVSLLRLFPFKSEIFDDGFKYLGFLLKANGYRPKDWD